MKTFNSWAFRFNENNDLVVRVVVLDSKNTVFFVAEARTPQQVKNLLRREKLSTVGFTDALNDFEKYQS